jgi:colanic acid/amylovoran biosynthesis glycosyltransferase
LYRLDRLSGRPGAYDVLHAHFGPVGESFRFARELWKSPLVVSFHGYDFTTLPRKHGAGMYGKLFAAADAVTANSEFTRGRLADLGCPAEKLRLLPVGLDLGDPVTPPRSPRGDKAQTSERQSPLKSPARGDEIPSEAFSFAARTLRAGESVRLVTVARLVEIKGHEFALRAVAKLRSQRAKMRYDIVGDGPSRLKLESLVAKLGLADTVTLHGARDGVYVRELMAKAHLAMLVSVNIEGDAEGQGLFLQEAQACGLPVIATQHGALPEGLIPGKSGFVVPERDVEALTERLTYLLAHPEIWLEMGRRGRAFVEQRFDCRKLNERLVQIYREAMTRFAGNRGDKKHGH